MQHSRLIELALIGLEAERIRLDHEIAQVRNQLKVSTASSGGGTSVNVRKRKKMSAEARRRISAGMKARWAQRRRAASQE